MKPMAAMLMVLVTTGAAGAASSPQVTALREQLKVHEAVLASELVELGQHQESLQESFVRINRESADYLRAQEQSESLESLRLRDSDLRYAESELLMHVFEAQRLRRSMQSTRAIIEETEAQIRQLLGQEGALQDPISGEWKIVVEPGGQTGKLVLQLDGTLIQGVYELEGGWRGSVRGTLVAGKVRLERIDSELGFAAIYYGQLGMSGGARQLVGRWESTQLASGLPAAGSWIAERIEE